MKNRKIKIHTLMIILILALSLTTPLYAGLIEDMVILDRAYIPALALTNQPDKPAALVSESMGRLNVAWEKFTKGLSPSERQNASLFKAIQESEKKINEAGKLISTGKRKDAHEALETIRMEFWKARTAMGLDYLPDRLTAFHDLMEEFYDQAVKPGVEAVKLKGLLSELSTRWSEVEKITLNTRLFGFTQEKEAKYIEMVKKERQILTQISALIGSGNQETLVKAAGSMKGNFAQIYLLFGDFTGL